MRIVTIISVLMFALVLAGCSAQRLYSVNHASISPSQTLSQIEPSIVAALSYKNWQIRSQQPGEIVARIDVRQHSATVSIRYDQKSFSIKYVKSEQLEYRAKQNSIHRNYNKWVKLLEKEIRHYINNPNAQKIQNH
ncbi:MAG: hypothetical protein HRT35_21055 [Algicola sp.]|nr:hypothetical protein [Algicola sp.]